MMIDLTAGGLDPKDWQNQKNVRNGIKTETDKAGHNRD
jgi:hypothetical protein